MASNLRLQVLLAALVIFAHAGVALGDIYQWTDEKGGVVYSNIRPADIKKVRDFKVVMEDRPASPRPMRAPSPLAAVPPDLSAQEAALAAQVEALRRQQALQERVASLERELQALQYAAPAPEPGYYADSFYPSYGGSWSYPYSYAVPYVIVSPRFTPAIRSPFRVPRGVPFRGPFHGGGAFHAGGSRAGFGAHGRR